MTERDLTEREIAEYERWASAHPDAIGTDASDLAASGHAPESWHHSPPGSQARPTALARGRSLTKLAAAGRFRNDIRALLQRDGLPERVVTAPTSTTTPGTSSQNVYRGHAKARSARVTCPPQSRSTREEQNSHYEVQGGGGRLTAGTGLVAACCSGRRRVPGGRQVLLSLYCWWWFFRGRPGCGAAGQGPVEGMPGSWRDGLRWGLPGCCGCCGPRPG